MSNIGNTSVPFRPADILIPKCDLEKWAVIACDQHTSRPEYWEEAERLRAGEPSALDLIFPEVYLGKGNDAKRIEKINAAMKEYLHNGIYERYENALIYVERIQPDGRMRPGIIGAIDLDAYDFSPNAKCDIRATEMTVKERIPARVAIRRDACTELPHAMMLINDTSGSVIRPLTEVKDGFVKLYDFPLMLGGGRVSGYLIPQSLHASVLKALSALRKSPEEMLIAVGDGNHSLAAAKVSHEQAPNELNRYALVELVDLHSDALDFEPIYRIAQNVAPDALIREFEAFLARGEHASAKNGSQRYTVISRTGEKTLIAPNAPHPLAVGTVQLFLDAFAAEHPEMKIDYIHGQDELRRLVNETDGVGFLYGGITKDTLFSSIEVAGTLPRKTFSMGTSADKRYYLEARIISPTEAEKYKPSNI